MDQRRPIRRALTAALLLGALSLTLQSITSCDKSDDAQYTPRYSPTASTTRPTAEYTFGIFPLHNPVRLFEVYEPMIDSINRQATDISIRLESSRDYQDYEAKVTGRSLCFAITNPYQAVLASQHGYRIFGKMSGDERFRGVIVVRKDSGIQKVEDLRNQVISFPAPTAFAATMMNKMLLHERGLNVETDAIPRYVGSQDSSLMNVYTGQSKAGGTWLPTWETLQKERPEVAAELEVKWQTEPLIQLALIARDDVPTEHVARVADALFHLNETDAGRSILRPIGTPGFEPATIATYEPAKRFLVAYEAAFGALPTAAATARATQNGK